MDNENTVRVDCIIKHETDRAVLIDNDDQELWLPKSVIEIDKIGDGNAILFVPEWLAKNKGLA
jgi:hypothetical protein